jgi:hypothetical protein
MKVKVKLSLCLTKHHAMKTYWGSRSIPPRIHSLGARWRRVVSFTSEPLYPSGKTPDTHWIRGWVGPRAGLDAVVKKKIPSTCRESKPDCATRSLIAILTQLPRLLWEMENVQNSD